MQVLKIKKSIVGMWKSCFLAFPKDCGKLEEFSKQLWESRRDFHNCDNPGISTIPRPVEMLKSFLYPTFLFLLTRSPSSPFFITDYCRNGCSSLFLNFCFLVLYDSPSRLYTLAWCSNLSNKAVVITPSPIISAQVSKLLFEVTTTERFSQSLGRCVKR